MSRLLREPELGLYPDDESAVLPSTLWTRTEPGRPALTLTLRPAAQPLPGVAELGFLPRGPVGVDRPSLSPADCARLRCVLTAVPEASGL